MTQITLAKQGKVSDEMYRISRIENVDVEEIRRLVSVGQAVIIKNSTRINVIECAVGSGLKTKVMANIGVINRQTNLENELEEFKANVSEENLKLKVPYVTDRSGENIGFELDKTNMILTVYSGDTAVGQISLT